MKRALKQIWVLAAMLLTFLPASADYDFEVDGLGYTILSASNLTVEVNMLVDKSLSEVVVPQEVEYKDRQLQVIGIGSSAFEETDIESVLLPDSIQYICEWAFSHCGNLRSIDLPNSLQRIERYAFSGCKSLELIAIPDNITELSDNIFSGCTKLTEITFGKIARVGHYAFSGTAISHLELPETLKNIGAKCFEGCQQLKSLYIQSCRNMDASVIWDCYSLKTLKIGAGVSGLPYESDNRRMEMLTTEYTYSRGEWEVVVHNEISEVILEDSDDYFSIKTEVDDDYPYGLDYNPVYHPAFSNTNVSYYYVGRPLTDIDDWGMKNDAGRYCFMARGHIDNLEIGGGCTYVPHFYQEIDALILGEGVLSFDTDSIAYLGSLRSIFCKSSVPPKLTGEFPEAQYVNLLVYVPEGSKEVYQNADGWKEFWSIEEYDPAGVTPIEERSSSLRVVASDGILKILNKNADAVCQIYNLQGGMVKSTKDNIVPNLAKGVYIVRVGGKSYKIIL